MAHDIEDTGPGLFESESEDHSDDDRRRGDDASTLGVFDWASRLGIAIAAAELVGGNAEAGYVSLLLDNRVGRLMWFHVDAASPNSFLGRLTKLEDDRQIAFVPVGANSINRVDLTAELASGDVAVVIGNTNARMVRAPKGHRSVMPDASVQVVKLLTNILELRDFSVMPDDAVCRGECLLCGETSHVSCVLCDSWMHDHCGQRAHSKTMCAVSYDPGAVKPDSFPSGRARGLDAAALDRKRCGAAFTQLNDFVVKHILDEGISSAMCLWCRCITQHLVAVCGDG